MAGASFLNEAAGAIPCKWIAALKHMKRGSGFTGSLSPAGRQLASLLLKKQGIDDALIQPYSGHASRGSPCSCSRYFALGGTNL